jgi:hypothetical protein
MTVAELIKTLRTLPRTARVLTQDSYEEGTWDDFVGIDLTYHEEDHSKTGAKAGDMIAVVLCRRKTD